MQILHAHGRDISGGTIGTVAAAGSSATDATAIVSDVVYVTGADGTKGVILPNMGVGGVHYVSNEAGSTLKVYPPTSGTLNGLTATTGNVSIAANKGGIFLRVTDIKWVVVYA